MSYFLILITIYIQRALIKDKAPDMTKVFIRKAIATRSRLENEFHRKRTKENICWCLRNNTMVVVDCTKRKERNFKII